MSDANERETALVTGATSGIGLEMARLLAARGIDLVLVSRSGPKLDEIARALEKPGGVTVRTFAADLAEPGAPARVAAFTDGEEIDYLVNNAGVGLYGEHVALDADGLQRMLQLNVGSLTELCLLYGRQMRRRGRGRILNVASTAAYQPAPFFAAYGASKSFVLNFSEALAKELEDHGVTVSCLSPGPTDTAFFGAMDERGLANAHFAKSARHDAARVAAIGIDLMMAGKLSKIVGAGNYLRAFSARFASRPMVAAIAKRLLAHSAGAEERT